MKNNVLKNIFSLLDLKSRGVFFYLCFLMVISTVAEILGLSLILPFIYSITGQNIFDRYESLQGINQILGYPNNESIILISLFSILCIYLIKNLFLTYYLWQEGKFIFDTQENISSRLFGEYLIKKFSFFLSRNSADFISRIKSDIGYASNAINSLMTLISESLIVVGISLALFFYNSFAFFIIIVTLSILSILYYLIVQKKLGKLSKIRMENETLRIKRLQEGFGGIKEIKVFNLEKFFLEKYFYTVNTLAKVYKFTYVIQRLPKLYFETMAVIAIVLVTYFLAKNTNNLVEILPLLGIYAGAAFKLLPSANRILNTFNVFKFSQNSVSVILEELNEEQSVLIDNSSKKITNKVNKIKFQNVSFKYENREKYLFRNINFEIEAGKKIFITGKTGAGKSTLINLILGLLKTSSGEILIDKKNISEIQKKWLSEIGYVPQNVFLFDDSIKENIILSKKKEPIDVEWLNKVLQISQCNEFIDKLPQTLETKVGEKGYNLSGGQKQRIGIARAIYRKPSILIFDESTNSLDNLIEKQVLEAIFRNLKNTSLIMISHKEELINYFDKNIQINDDEIKINNISK